VETLQVASRPSARSRHGVVCRVRVAVIAGGGTAIVVVRSVVVVCVVGGDQQAAGRVVPSSNIATDSSRRPDLGNSTL
jgi:hypothetical protein